MQTKQIKRADTVRSTRPEKPEMAAQIYNVHVIPVVYSIIDPIST